MVDENVEWVELLCPRCDTIVKCKMTKDGMIHIPFHENCELFPKKEDVV